MKIHTFYWTPSPRRWEQVRAGKVWRFGNAGDMFNATLLNHFYGKQHQISDDGRRILFVGSVAHRIRPGDLVCGIGWKGTDIPSAGTTPLTVLGVRGPITYDAFRKAGHDMSGVRFQLDPGLVVGALAAKAGPAVAPERGRTIVIPHYQDGMAPLRHVRGPSRVKIDMEPLALAREIQRAELVYASSLHGMIFAHALGRPCVPYAPLTKEPQIKYFDYLESVGIHRSTLPSLDEALRGAKPDSPIDQPWLGMEDRFPTLDELRDREIYR